MNVIATCLQNHTSCSEVAGGGWPCAAAFGWPGLVYPAIKVPCLGAHVSYKTGQLMHDSCATAKHTSPVSHHPECICLGKVTATASCICLRDCSWQTCIQIRPDDIPPC